MKFFRIAIILIGIMGIQTASSEELFDIKSSDERFNNGLTLYFETRYEEAIQAFNESITINPGNAKAYYFIGYSYYEKGDYKNASLAFETAYRFNTDYSPQPPSKMEVVPISDLQE